MRIESARAGFWTKKELSRVFAAGLSAKLDAAVDPVLIPVPGTRWILRVGRTFQAKATKYFHELMGDRSQDRWKMAGFAREGWNARNLASLARPAGIEPATSGSVFERVADTSAATGKGWRLTPTRAQSTGSRSQPSVRNPGNEARSESTHVAPGAWTWRLAFLTLNVGARVLSPHRSRYRRTICSCGSSSHSRTISETRSLTLPPSHDQFRRGKAGVGWVAEGFRATVAPAGAIEEQAALEGHPVKKLWMV